MCIFLPKWTSSEKRTRINHLANSEQLFVIRLNGNSSKQASKLAPENPEKKENSNNNHHQQGHQFKSNGQKSFIVFVVCCFRNETLQARKTPNKRYKTDTPTEISGIKPWTKNQQLNRIRKKERTQTLIHTQRLQTQRKITEGRDSKKKRNSDTNKKTNRKSKRRIINKTIVVAPAPKNEYKAATRKF